MRSKKRVNLYVPIVLTCHYEDVYLASCTNDLLLLLLVLILVFVFVLVSVFFVGTVDFV